MTIEKLPSGSYRIREMRDGVTYSVTVKHKPSHKEAVDLIEDKIEHLNNPHMAFLVSARSYIEIKRNVLSPSTVRGYNAILRNMPTWFTIKDITEIDDLTLQRLVSEYSATHTPKYTRNVYGFVRAVIRLFIPSSTISATLPQNVRREPYTPSHDDVKRLLEYTYDTPYYVPLYLSALSLRRSEIMALSLDDLNGNNLTINKALVPCDNGYILKPTPKNDASNRVITLPDELVNKIKSQGFIFEYNPHAIDGYLRRTLPKLGIPVFSVHKLRHYFASYAHELGYSDALIQSLGGWSTDHVMKSVYRHAMEKDEARESIAKDFSF